MNGLDNIGTVPALADLYSYSENLDLTFSALKNSDILFYMRFLTVSLYGNI